MLEQSPTGSGESGLARLKPTFEPLSCGSSESGSSCKANPLNCSAILLSKAGEVVSREELQQQIWGSETVVNFDHSLGSAVNKVREALGDTAENPRYIETLAKRGYRFIAPVVPVDLPPVARKNRNRKFP